jgi:signal transduction histidine kinase
MYDESSNPDFVKDQLEKQLFHLKTLYDVSRELLGEVNVEKILKDFLLMTTGNFGVVDGFLLLRDQATGRITHFVSVGFRDELHPLLQKGGDFLLSGQDGGKPVGGAPVSEFSDTLPPSVVCSLPFRLDGTAKGLLGLGAKLIGEDYLDDDKNLLLTLVNNLVIALKNARYAEALEKAYAEVSTLNRAKTKVIDHLSHELKTPMAVLQASLSILEKIPTLTNEEKWKRPLERAQRSVTRLTDIQNEVDDIMEGKVLRSYGLMNQLLDECADELETLVAEKVGEGAIVEWIRRRIEELFGPREWEVEEIPIGAFVQKTLEEMEPLFAKREIQMIKELDPDAKVIMPKEPLEKVLRGLVKNAIENTPDGGKVFVTVKRKTEGTVLEVKDTGVGIIGEYRKHIFEGFFPTQETLAYSSKNPFDFNAGGKGADLLRMKIFSERHHFTLTMNSTRCRFLPNAWDVCPGKIGACKQARKIEECCEAGGSSFEVLFPYAPGKESSNAGPGIE